MCLSVRNISYLHQKLLSSVTVGPTRSAGSSGRPSRLMVRNQLVNLAPSVYYLFRLPLLVRDGSCLAKRKVLRVSLIDEPKFRIFPVARETAFVAFGCVSLRLQDCSYIQEHLGLFQINSEVLFSPRTRARRKSGLQVSCEPLQDERSTVTNPPLRLVKLTLQ